MEEAVPYFEDFVGKMKESYGSKHCTIVYAYYNLGSNYAKINKPHSSTLVFAYAKNIFDESFGPLHPDTIQAYTSLCRAYTSLGSYSLAIETLDMTVKHTMEAQVPDAQNDLAQAAILREKLKVKVAATEISESLTNTLTFPKDDKSTSGKDSQTVTS